MSNRSELQQGTKRTTSALIRLLNDSKSTLGERCVRILASDGSLDSHGTTINPNGWRLENYLKNPTILWMHNQRELPIGQAVSVAVTSRGLEIVVQFATAEENPFADYVYRLVKGGYIRSGSVGFYPLKWTIRENEDVVDFLEQELFEFSFTNVGSNPNALVLQKSADNFGDLRDVLNAAPTNEFQELRDALAKADVPKAAPAAINRARRQVDVNRNSLNA